MIIKVPEQILGGTLLGLQKRRGGNRYYRDLDLEFIYAI